MAMELKGSEYEFVPFWDEYGSVINKKTTRVDIYEMDRYTMDLCNGRQFNSFRKLFIKWQNSTAGYSTAGSTFLYKDFFIDFMTHQSEKDTLPHFLEFLSKEHVTDSTPNTQKEPDPPLSFSFPPKPINRDQSIEKATWKTHIEPIVKTHGLRKLSGEHFEYQFFEKQVDEKVSMQW